MSNEPVRYKCSDCVKGCDCLEEFETVMLDDSVFRCLDEKMTTFTGIHYLFSDFESGAMELYKCLADNGKLLGFVFGVNAGDSFNGHLMFIRNADALSCVQQVESVIRSVHPEVKKFVADIPECNWAAIRVAKKFGCVDKGEGNNGFVHNGKIVKTRLYVKEL